MSLEIPKNHPRYQSLLIRERIIEGCHAGVVAEAGLIAHGRGEAFDYLLGEQTGDFALEAIRAAACAFLVARRPIISVNGNVAALCAKELVQLSRAAHAPLEVNLFYRTEAREHAVERRLRDAGAEEVFGVGPAASGVIPELGSDRRRVDPRGILVADLVFVPLEDGDRTEALVEMGKQVVTVDLNPLSRTAVRASITIVDNILRALPKLINVVLELSSGPRAALEDILAGYDNARVRGRSLTAIAERLTGLSLGSDRSAGRSGQEATW